METIRQEEANPEANVGEEGERELTGGHHMPQGPPPKAIFLLFALWVALGVSVLINRTQQLQFADLFKLSKKPIYLHQTAPIPDVSRSMQESSIDRIRNIISPAVTSSETLDDETSPQYKALVWLAEEEGDDAASASRSDATDDEIIERYCLAVVFYSTEGEQWTNGYNFLSTKHVCDWNGFYNSLGFLAHGVTQCDPDGRVMFLILDRNALKGTLPSELGHLPALSFLSMAENELVGSLPAELGQLSELYSIKLENNQLISSDDGTAFPDSWQNLKSLRFIKVKENDLEGDAEALCEALPDLKVFEVDKLEVSCSCCECCPASPSHDSPETDRLDQVITIVTPSVSDAGQFGDTSSAHYQAAQWLAEEDEARINLDDTQRVIQRYILALLYFATDGENWEAQYDWLSEKHECDWYEIDDDDDIAYGVFTCDVDLRVTGLFFASNYLRGQLLPELKELPLMVLAMIDNLIYGTIPEEYSEMQDLAALGLSGNRLNGEVPQSFVELESLGLLWLSRNRLVGSVNFLCDEFGADLDMRVDRDEVECDCCDCCPEDEE